MCGIAGIAFFNGHSPIDMTLLKGMCDTLVHRGPDEEGIGIRDGVGFGMSGKHKTHKKKSQEIQ